MGFKGYSAAIYRDICPAEGRPPSSCKAFLIRNSEFVHVEVMRYSCPSLIFRIVSSPKETTMKEWLKPEITESEAGMEVTSYLPAELDRA
jgi:coenzyme PQQ precursor peptide PqqA